MTRAIIFLLSLPVFLSAQPASADVAAGKAKAEAVCQTCHGMDGKATIPTAANISGQQKGYLIAQLQAYRSGKRSHEQMGIVSKMLSDGDIESLAEWYSSIKVTIEMPR